METINNNGMTILSSQLNGLENQPNPSLPFCALPSLDWEAVITEAKDKSWSFYWSERQSQQQGFSGTTNEEAEKDLLATKNSRKEIKKGFLKSEVFLISDGPAG